MHRGKAAICAIALLGGALSVASTPGLANPEGGVRVGVLKCYVESGFGLIFGSTRQVDCVYTSAGGNVVETYAGRITRFGVDIGYLDHGVMLWGVFAPTSDIEAKALAGEYVGASAEASVGVGVGVNALVGGLDKSFALQPISIEGVTGLNVAAGIAELSLSAAEN